MECEKTRKLCTELKNVNALVFAIVGSTRQEPGWPDRWISHKLWTGFIEFKDERTAIKKKQRWIIQQINKRSPGGAFFVRFPNRIESWDGKLIDTFDGTALGLLRKLQVITVQVHVTNSEP